MDAPEKDPPVTPKAEKAKSAQKRTGSRRDERSRRRADSHEVSQASDKGSRRSDVALGSQQSSVMTAADDRSQFSRRSNNSRRSRRSASRESSKAAPSEKATARAEIEAAVPEVSLRPEVTPSIEVAPPPQVAPSPQVILPLAGDTAAAAASASAPVQQQDETGTSEKPAPAAPGDPTQPSTRRASKQLEEAPAGTQATAIEPQPEAAPGEQQQAEDAAEHRPEAHQTARFSNAPVHEDERPESKRPVVIAAVAIIVFVLVVAILKQLRAAPADVAVCVGQGCANSTQTI